MGYFYPLKKKIVHRPILVLDIESKDGPSQKAGFTRPFMVGAYSDLEKYLPFYNTNPKSKYSWDEAYWKEGGCIDRLMRYLLQKKFLGYHIYAHNAGKFDYLFLLPWLMNIGTKLGYSFGIVPVSSSIQILDVWVDKNKTNRFRFLDSIRLLPIALDKAAKTFGLEGKKQHDLNLHENDPSWIDYNEQDCVQLFNILTKMHHYIENVLCGEVGVTAPSTAVKILRRNYVKKPLPRHEETHDFVRKAYFGGRVEVYKTKGENLRYYDINSSYPAAMLQSMPAGRATIWEGSPPDWLMEEQIGFCNVDVEVPTTSHIPPLPIRSDGSICSKGKLIFPTGKLTGTWEWDELKLAIDNGTKIHKWHYSIWYEPVFLFKEFVEDLYKYRDKSRPEYDEGLAAVVKIMLNATYGKFGMRTERKKIFLWNDPDLPSNAIPANGQPDCPIWYSEETTDACYIMPQVAARVTALARIALYKAIKQSSPDIYYCDTDSVITKKELPTSTALGALKDEFPEQSGKLFGEFLGPKLYLLSCDSFEKIKAKGFQKENRNRESIMSLAHGDTLIMKRLEKIGTLARNSFSRGPREIIVPRKLIPDTGKRLIHEDGSTSPYNLRMW